MNHFDGILFDMDGLLLDSERLAQEAFLRTCRNYGLGDRRDVFRRCIGVKWEDGQKILESEFGGEIEADSFAEDWNRDYHLVTDSAPIPLKPGVREILQYIEKLNTPMAVATSTRTVSAEAKLERAGIRNFFRNVIGGDQIRQGKPDPSIYLKAAEAINQDPTRCLAFEDSEIGARAALAAGMTVVQIPDLVEPSLEMRNLGPIILEQLDMAIDYPFPDLPMSE